MSTLLGWSLPCVIEACLPAILWMISSFNCNMAVATPPRSLESAVWVYHTFLPKLCFRSSGASGAADLHHYDRVTQHVRLLAMRTLHLSDIESNGDLWGLNFEHSTMKAIISAQRVTLSHEADNDDGIVNSNSNPQCFEHLRFLCFFSLFLRSLIAILLYSHCNLHSIRILLMRQVSGSPKMLTGTCCKFVCHPIQKFIFGLLSVLTIQVRRPGMGIQH